MNLNCMNEAQNSRNDSEHMHFLFLIITVGDSEFEWNVGPRGDDCFPICSGAHDITQTGEFLRVFGHWVKVYPKDRSIFKRQVSHRSKFNNYCETNLQSGGRIRTRMQSSK